MKNLKVHLCLIFLGFQLISSFAWEIYPEEKIYSIFQNNQDTGNPANVVARLAVSSTTGDLGNGGIMIELIPNQTHGGIVRTVDILDIIPGVAALCARNYPAKPIESFGVDIRLIRDIWDEYRQFVIGKVGDAPGKVEFKSEWFQQETLRFTRSNRNIEDIQKTVSQYMVDLADPILVIPGEIHFVPEGIGLRWDTVERSPGLYIAKPPVVTLISKQSRDGEPEN